MAIFFKGEKVVKCVAFVALAFPALGNFVIRSKITKEKTKPPIGFDENDSAAGRRMRFEKPVTLFFIYIHNTSA